MQNVDAVVNAFTMLGTHYKQKGADQIFEQLIRIRAKRSIVKKEGKKDTQEILKNIVSKDKDDMQFMDLVDEMIDCKEETIKVDFIS